MTARAPRASARVRARAKARGGLAFALAVLAGGFAWALAGPRAKGPAETAVTAGAAATSVSKTIRERVILPAWHPDVLPGEGWVREHASADAPAVPGSPASGGGGERIVGSAPRMVVEWFGPAAPATIDAVVRLRSAREAEVELSLPHVPGWTRRLLPAGDVSIPMRLRTEHPSEVLHLEIVASRPELPPALELLEVEMSPSDAAPSAEPKPR